MHQRRDEPHPDPANGTATFEKIDNRTWRFTYKGTVSNVGLYSVSEDGNRLDATTKIRWADNNEEVRQSSYRREGIGKGLAGDWVSTKVETKSSHKPWVMTIAPGDHGALLLNMPAEGVVYVYRFDGKPYPDPTPSAPKGSTLATQRPTRNTLHAEFKRDGKTTSSGDFQLSGDGKTMTVHQVVAQQSKPIVYVMERQ